MLWPRFEPSRFHLRDMARNPINRKVLALIGTPLEKVLSINRINAIYQELREQPVEDDFLTLALKRLGIRYDFDPEQLSQIPKHGPLVVVANHPYGLVEGMILADLLRQARPERQDFGQSYAVPPARHSGLRHQR